nr:hypothetical protein [uncultured archaeon]
MPKGLSSRITGIKKIIDTFKKINPEKEINRPYIV